MDAKILNLNIYIIKSATRGLWLYVCWGGDNMAEWFFWYRKSGLEYSSAERERERGFGTFFGRNKV